MSDEELETFARSLLGETTLGAKWWSPGEFAAYKQVALINIMNEFWNLLLPITRDFELANRTSGSNTVDFPDDCFKLSRFEIASTGQKIKFIDDDELWKYTGLDDEDHCIIKDGKIMLLYTPTATETGYFRIWFVPKINNTLSKLPEELHPLVGVDIAMTAKIKDDQLKAHLMSLRNHYANNAKIALCIPQAQDFGGIRDFSGDEEYD